MKKNTTIIPKISWLSLLSVLLTLCFGCAGTSEEEQKAKETNPLNMPSPPQNKLAPGTAKIVAHLIKIEKENNLHTCIFVVDKVLGYGMSTKPIGTGTEISLAILNEKEDLINLLADGTTEQKFELTVEQGLMVDNQVKWKSVRIKKIDFEQ